MNRSNRTLLIAPSLLSADFANLAEDIRMVQDAGADWLHIDVMDGHFVPNITIGPLVVESVRRVTSLPLDVHLMIDDPNRYIPDFARAGADLLTVHFESCKNLKRTIDSIRKYDIKAGISIKPRTPVKKIIGMLKSVDLVLVMTVEPGFGGQKFMPKMMSKVSALRGYIDDRELDCFLEVDGGINPDTARVAVDAGADVLVAGHAIFKTADPAGALKDLKCV